MICSILKEVEPDPCGFRIAESNSDKPRSGLSRDFYGRGYIWDYNALFIVPHRAPYSRTAISENMSTINVGTGGGVRQTLIRFGLSALLIFTGVLTAAGSLHEVNRGMRD